MRTLLQRLRAFIQRQLNTLRSRIRRAICPFSCCIHSQDDEQQLWDGVGDYQNCLPIFDNEGYAREAEAEVHHAVSNNNDNIAIWYEEIDQPCNTAVKHGVDASTSMDHLDYSIVFVPEAESGPPVRGDENINQPSTSTGITSYDPVLNEICIETYINDSFVYVTKNTDPVFGDKYMCNAKSDQSTISPTPIPNFGMSHVKCACKSSSDSRIKSWVGDQSITSSEITVEDPITKEEEEANVDTKKKSEELAGLLSSMDSLEKSGETTWELTSFTYIDIPGTRFVTQEDDECSLLVWHSCDAFTSMSMPTSTPSNESSVFLNVSDICDMSTESEILKYNMEQKGIELVALIGSDNEEMPNSRFNSTPAKLLPDNTYFSKIPLSTVEEQKSTVYSGFKNYNIMNAAASAFKSVAGKPKSLHDPGNRMEEGSLWPLPINSCIPKVFFKLSPKKPVSTKRTIFSEIEIVIEEDDASRTSGTHNRSGLNVSFEKEFVYEATPDYFKNEVPKPTRDYYNMLDEMEDFVKTFPQNLSQQRNSCPLPLNPQALAIASKGRELVPTTEENFFRELVQSLEHLSASNNEFALREPNPSSSMTSYALRFDDNVHDFKNPISTSSPIRSKCKAVGECTGRSDIENEKLSFFQEIPGGIELMNFLDQLGPLSDEDEDDNGDPNELLAEAQNLLAHLYRTNDQESQGTGVTEETVMSKSKRNLSEVFENEVDTSKDPQDEVNTSDARDGLVTDDTDDELVILDDTEDEVVTDDAEDEVVTLDDTEDEVVTLDDSEDEVVTDDSEDEVVTDDSEDEVVTDDSEDEVVTLDDTEDEVVTDDTEDEMDTSIETESEVDLSTDSSPESEDEVEMQVPENHMLTPPASEN